MRSWLKWFGGKYYFLKYLFPFPQHTIYTEPFGGSGVVLLNKPISKIEVYNDLNHRLVNAWQCLQNRLEDLRYLMQYKGNIRHRILFDRYKEPSSDPLEDAFRFFYTNRYSFSGICDTYVGISMEEDKRQATKEYWSTIELLETIQQRIKHVIFENQDFRIIIKRMDSEDTFFYIDPPYAKGGQNYIRINGLDIQWSPVHYIELLQLLVHIKGKFLLSTDILDNLYPKWHIRTINRINNFSPIKSELRTTDKEYLISNYDPAIVQTQSEKNQSTLNGFVKKERIENDFET